MIEMETEIDLSEDRNAGMVPANLNVLFPQPSS